MCHCSNTRVELTPKKSQHAKLTLEKKILLWLLLGFELATFWSRVWHSYQQAILAPATSIPYPVCKTTSAVSSPQWRLVVRELFGRQDNLQCMAAFMQTTLVSISVIKKMSHASSKSAIQFSQSFDVSMGPEQGKCWKICRVGPSGQVRLAPWSIGLLGRHKGRFNKDPRQDFSVGGYHEQGCPLSWPVLTGEMANSS